MLKQSIIVLLAAAASASAAEIKVTELRPDAPVKVVDQWYKAEMRNAGTAVISDLTGLGGNLESNQPTVDGAVRLTTTSDVNDKAIIGTFGDFGLASDVLGHVDLSYTYFKQPSILGPQAAPAIKLVLQSSTGIATDPLNRSYGILIFEPSWNAALVTGDWTTVNIDQSTGGGANDATGGWWWSGGFGIPNAAGGPPLRSLEEWLAAFNSGTGAANFADAHVVGLEVGVGSYNQQQDDYFDKVSIKTASVDKTYNFSVPDNGSTAALLGLGFLGMVWVRSRQQRAANA